MSFIYINPGYAELMNNANFATERNNFTYSPLNGVSLAKSTSDEITFYPALPGYFASDIYMKFNFYSTEAKYPTTTFRFFTKENNITLWITPTYVKVVRILASGKTSTETTFTTLKNSYGVKANEVNQVYFSIAASKITCMVNERTQSQNWDTIPAPATTGKPMSIIFSDTENINYFSEIIISDEYFSPDTRVAIVPASKIETNMTSTTDGKYQVTASNQSLMMTPDFSTLFENYGSGSNVHGIAVGGVPFEKTGTGTSTFTGLSKSSGTITEHTTVEVGNNASGFATAWTVSDTTLEDLQDQQFGLKSV